MFSNYQIIRLFKWLNTWLRSLDPLLDWPQQSMLCVQGTDKKGGSNPHPSFI